ncbi:MAG: hypothetical protein HXX20_11970 [Chloroflexi bacterium]|nr:hypothetical protein [Chloroflexota bacterium]
MTNESQNQPSKFEKTLRGNFLKKQDLILLLLACPSIANRASRDNLISGVHNGKLVAKVARNAVDKIDVQNIVNTLLDYPGVLEELISFMRLEDSGTQAFQALETFRSALLVDSFPSDNIEGKAPSKSEDVLEFVNQTKALDTIYDNPQILNFIIDAPLGYGKTRLLEQVKIHFEQEGWAIYLVECDKFGPDILISLAHSFGILDSTNIESLEELSVRVTDRLQQQLNNTGTILLIIDSLHILLDDFQVSSIKVFLSSIRSNSKKYGGSKLKIILSGRYLSQYEFFSVPNDIPTLISLEPFNLKVIKQAIKHRYIKMDLPREDFFYSLLARHLYIYSGGHPKLVSDIFAYGETSFNNIESINGWFCKSSNLNHIRSRIEPNFRKIKRELDPKIWSALETLCIFRKFDISLLRHLQKENQLNGQVTPFKLADKLTQTRLVDLNGRMYSDGILRPVILISLYIDDPNRLGDLCEIAEKYFKQKFLKERHEESLIELVYTRLIKHRRQALAEDDKEREGVYNNITKACEETSGDLIEELIRNKLSSKISKDIQIEKLISLISLLEKDEELEFLFNYTLRDEKRLNLYSDWIKLIRTKAKELETENK